MHFITYYAAILYGKTIFLMEWEYPYELDVATVSLN